MTDVITFVYEGKRYPMPDKMTFGDASLLKKVGVNLAALAEAFREGDTATLSDPLVMGGLLLVSMRHAGERVNANTLNDMEISSVDVEMPDEEGEEEAPLAPPEPKTPDQSGETILVDSGTPASDTSSESTPGS